MKRLSMAGIDFSDIEIPCLTDGILDLREPERLLDVIDGFQLDRSFEIFLVRVSAHKDRDGIRKNFPA